MGSIPRATAEDSKLPHLHTDLPSTSYHSSHKEPPAPGLPHASATSDQLKLQPLTHSSRYREVPPQIPYIYSPAMLKAV